MARYKHIDTSPRFLAVDLQRQLLPGTFEHALNHLIDHELDLSSFDARFRNDETGAAAYPPAMLLKVILFAYSQSIISSRDIEAAAVITLPLSPCLATPNRTSPRLPHLSRTSPTTLPASLPKCSTCAIARA